MDGRKISRRFWKAQLTENLKSLAEKSNFRLAIIGLGNILNGDDGVGNEVIHRLQTYLADTNDLLLIDGGTLPESTTSLLRRFKPDLVILIDAADFGDKPGTIRWIGTDEITGAGFSTHGVPLTMLVKYLDTEMNARTQILGIQPGSVEFGQGVSHSCKNSITTVVRVFRQLLMIKE